MAHLCYNGIMHGGLLQGRQNVRQGLAPCQGHIRSSFSLWSTAPISCAALSGPVPYIDVWSPQTETGQNGFPARRNLLARPGTSVQISFHSTPDGSTSTPQHLLDNHRRHNAGVGRAAPSNGLGRVYRSQTTQDSASFCSESCDFRPPNILLFERVT